MKVYVNGKIFVSTETPIVIIMQTDKEREIVSKAIQNMSEDATLFASFPTEERDELIPIFEQLKKDHPKK